MGLRRDLLGLGFLKIRGTSHKEYGSLESILRSPPFWETTIIVWWNYLRDPCAQHVQPIQANAHDACFCLPRGLGA